MKATRRGTLLGIVKDLRCTMETETEKAKDCQL